MAQKVYLIKSNIYINIKVVNFYFKIFHESNSRIGVILLL